MRERAGRGSGGDANWTIVSPRKRMSAAWKGRQGQYRTGTRREHHRDLGQMRDNWSKGDSGVVSYYFTNFPSNIDRETLWGLFNKWGTVVDIFVPKKKNKEGKAFGFVRFRDVQYPQELERRLDQIWIGSFKLRANYVRYSRQADRQKEYCSGHGRNQHRPGVQPHQYGTRRTVGGSLLRTS